MAARSAFCRSAGVMAGRNCTRAPNIMNHGSRPSSRVAIDLEFVEPFSAKADTHFEFAAAPSGTTVTWTTSGDSNFVSKARCLFMGGMDKMIGPDFEKGLAQMTAVAEARK